MTTNGNGFTNKEMLNMLLTEVRILNQRLDELHEKTNSKISRQELLAWVTVLAVFIAGLNQYL